MARAHPGVRAARRAARPGRHVGAHGAHEARQTMKTQISPMLAASDGNVDPFGHLWLVGKILE